MAARSPRSQAAPAAARRARTEACGSPAVSSSARRIQKPARPGFPRLAQTREAVSASSATRAGARAASSSSQRALRAAASRPRPRWQRAASARASGERRPARASRAASNRPRDSRAAARPVRSSSVSGGGGSSSPFQRARAAGDASKAASSGTEGSAGADGRATPWAPPARGAALAVSRARPPGPGAPGRGPPPRERPPCRGCGPRPRREAAAPGTAARCRAGHAQARRASPRPVTAPRRRAGRSGRATAPGESPPTGPARRHPHRSQAGRPDRSAPDPIPRPAAIPPDRTGTAVPPPAGGRPLSGGFPVRHASASGTARARISRHGWKTPAARRVSGLGDIDGDFNGNEESWVSVPRNLKDTLGESGRPRDPGRFPQGGCVLIVCGRQKGVDSGGNLGNVVA